MYVCMYHMCCNALLLYAGRTQCRHVQSWQRLVVNAGLAILLDSYPKTARRRGRKTSTDRLFIVDSELECPCMCTCKLQLRNSNVNDDRPSSADDTDISTAPTQHTASIYTYRARIYATPTLCTFSIRGSIRHHRRRFVVPQIDKTQ